MIYITRRERFNAAHRMFREEWDAEKNMLEYGKCSNPNWHGHNYNLYVTIKGELDPETGLLINLKKLSAIVKSKVIERIDHKNMNIDVDFMQGKIASTENLCMAIWEILKPEIDQLGVHLHSVKIEETENNIVEYFG
jgi:6-pyruvoyltetrahydropterin/6-carboxytetrahydropterin synthase